MKTGKVKITCRIRGTKKKKTCTVTVKKKAKKKYIKPTKITLTCKANPKVKAYVYVIVEYDD